MLASIGGLAFGKATVLLTFSLIATWTLATILPTYEPLIRTKISTQLSKTHSQFELQLFKTRQQIPRLKIDFHPYRDPRTAYNSSKLALLIEARPLPTLVPQLLHMISVVPPDWRFLFVGSNRSVMAVGRSLATQYQQAVGKLDLEVIPRPWSIRSKEHVWRMLTDVRFYDQVLPGVEWLLKFESDSILCANSGESLNDWMDYDWAGAPRTSSDRFAGNGGLSLRRLSAVRRVLSFQERYNDTQPEDEWFGKRLIVIPGLKIAKAEEESHFAVEDIWHEKPMGYHVREGGRNLPEGVWKSREQRKKIFEYCPEITMIMDMKLERERCKGDDGEGEIKEEEKSEQGKGNGNEKGKGKEQSQKEDDKRVQKSKEEKQDGKEEKKQKSKEERKEESTTSAGQKKTDKQTREEAKDEKGGDQNSKQENSSQQQEDEKEEKEEETKKGRSYRRELSLTDNI